MANFKQSGRHVSNYRIERFLHGELTRGEGISFLDQMLDDPSLRERVELLLFDSCPLEWSELIKNPAFTQSSS